MHILNQAPQSLNSAADGTVAAPSISFLADQDTGIYRIGANNIGVAAGGILRAGIGSDGITSYGLNNQIQTTDYVTSTTGSTMQMALLAATGNTSGKLEVYNTGGAAGGVLNINTSGGGAVNFGSGTATFAGAVVAPSLTAPASTALALAAGSGNQNITLTPSGTGLVKVAALPANAGNATAGSFTGVAFAAIIDAQFGLVYGASQSSGDGWIQQQSVVNGSYYNLTLQAAGGNVLIGTNTNSGARLQVGTNTTTTAGGMVFGTDTFLYRIGAASLALSGTGANPGFYIQSSGGANQFRALYNAGADVRLESMTNLPMYLMINSSIALTLDSSLKATFGGAIKLANAYVGTPVVSTGYVTIQDNTGTTYKIAVSL